MSLRTRLLASFLIVIITCGVVTVVVGVRMISEGIVEQAQNKVRLDLNSARASYQERANHVRDVVRHTSVRFFIKHALEGKILDALPELERIKSQEALDVFMLTDNRGVVLLRAGRTGSKGDDQAANPLIARALADKTPVSATEIVSATELAREGKALAIRARISPIPTTGAKPAEGKEQTSGMVSATAAPILAPNGELLGVLYGANLLNRDHQLVDMIKDIVYRGETYKSKDVGVATLFQGHMRISTNVTMASGQRAIGTCASADVSEQVLNRSEPWIERAFVVNEYYMTAYEPIRDSSGKPIGMLAVGMVERKFADMKRNTLWMFLGISFAGVVLAVLICLFLARTLSKPTNALSRAAQRLAAGDLTQRVQIDESTHEIGALGRSFNHMAAAIEERDQQLRRRAQEEIMKAERLAMIGQLAAGVAHEINNPLGGIMLFSRLLLKKAPAEGLERENLERISREAQRCQNIVQSLLDFARQREPKTEPVDVIELIDRTVALLEGQKLFLNITVTRDFAEDVPRVVADAAQLQQVLMNIIVNAAEATDGGGALAIAARPSPEDGYVEISFTDTGSGIPEANMDHLFEPFFTTKEVGHGTGLGLSISHGIVERHGGSLVASSREGEGSTFTVKLPMTGGKS